MGLITSLVMMGIDVRMTGKCNAMQCTIMSETRRTCFAVQISLLCRNTVVAFSLLCVLFGDAVGDTHCVRVSLFSTEYNDNTSYWEPSDDDRMDKVRCTPIVYAAHPWVT